MHQGRKISGGKYHARRKIRLHERKPQERRVILGETKRRTLRVRGGDKKITLLKANSVNLASGKGVKKAEIINGAINEPPIYSLIQR